MRNAFYLQSARNSLIASHDEHPLRPLPHSHRHPREEELKESLPNSWESNEGVELGWLKREASLPHQADAIFTELEDQLIHLKNHFCKRAATVTKAHPKSERGKVGQQLQGQLATWRSLCKQFKLMMGVWGRQQPLEKMAGEKVRLRISQALLQEQH